MCSILPAQWHEEEEENKYRKGFPSTVTLLVEVGAQWDTRDLSGTMTNSWVLPAPSPVPISTPAGGPAVPG